MLLSQEKTLCHSSKLHIQYNKRLFYIWSTELPIFLTLQYVILVHCIFFVGLFLTSACLVSSFALGQGFDELVNGHDAIQTDVMENNQPTGSLYVKNMLVKGKILIWKCSNNCLHHVVFGWRIYHCWSSSEFYLNALLSGKTREKFLMSHKGAFYIVRNKNHLASRAKGFPYFFFFFFLSKKLHAVCQIWFLNFSFRNSELHNSLSINIDFYLT